MITFLTFTAFHYKIQKGKSIKKLAKIALIILLFALAVPALSLLFLQNRQVQTQLSHLFTRKLSEELQTSVSVSSVHYSFFRRLQVRDLYIEDLNGDTLLYSGITRLRVKEFRPGYKGMTIRRITLEDAWVNVVIDTQRVVNMSFIIDRLKKPHVPPELKSRIQIASIELQDSRFSLSRMGKDSIRSGVDFGNFHLSDLNIRVKDLEVLRDTVTMDVTSIEARDRSGFLIRDIRTRLSIHRKHLNFDGLEIETGDSELDVPRLDFSFDRFRDFRRFSSRVDVDLVSRESDMSIADLSYFVPRFGEYLERISLRGRITGSLADLRGEQLEVAFDTESTLAFDFIMIGLPDVNNTFLDATFRRLSTSVPAINEIIGVPGDTIRRLAYPWINFGTLDFTGQFTGYLDHFVASGLMKSDMGRMRMDLSFEPGPASGIDFRGELSTEDFRIGQFLEQEQDLKELDMNVFAEGNINRGELIAQMKGNIDTLNILSYDYSNITLDGSFTNTTFDGGFSIRDPNIALDFQGTTDFTGEIPVYRFTADVARVRPYYLNLMKSDPEYFASFLVETDLSGKTLDDLNGEVRLVNSLFERKDAQVQLYDMSLVTRNTPAASLIRIRSELLDADVAGQYRLTELPSAFRRMADLYLDVNPGRVSLPDTTNYFEYSVDIKHVSPLLDFFVPWLDIGDQSRLTGTYDPRSFDIRMSAGLPSLTVAGYRWRGVEMEAGAGRDRVKAQIRTDSMSFGGSYALTNQQVDMVAAEDTARLSLRWDNRSTPVYSGNLALMGTFREDSLFNREFLVETQPGRLVVRNREWQVHRARMGIRKGLFRVDSLSIRSGTSSILAYGEISQEPGTGFGLDLQNLSLGSISEFAQDRVDLEGMITGFLHYGQMAEGPVVDARLGIDSLALNGQLLGSTHLDAMWNDSDNAVGIDVASEVDGKRIVEAEGAFFPGSRGLDFRVQLHRFALESLSRYAEPAVEGLEGEMHLDLTVDGTLDEPRLNGIIALDQGAATVDFLGVRYTFRDQLRIFRNNLHLEEFELRDPGGNRALLSGTLSHSNFRDFYINLQLAADNLLCMETGSGVNESFFGTIVATGNASLTGEPGNLRLDAQAATNRNTSINFPLYKASEVQSTDFITFVRDDSLAGSREETGFRNRQGIRMDLQVEITDDAEVQLIFDPNVGDIIRTRGNGKVRIEREPGQGVRMFGDVTLSRGDYLFTLQNVINKRFEIKPGGTIRFNGSPMEAIADLEAIYTTRAAPYNLYPDLDDVKQESLKRRIPVECHLFVQGELSTPTIATGIFMPTADAETRDLLENATSTDEELMKQFLSLLVINNFYSVTGFGSGTAGNMNSAVAGVTASELLSNQLSNWLSQISDDFDIGVNYRPGDQITSDEVEVALSTQLLNDRIIISGNVDVGGNETNPSSGTSGSPYIMGDFDVEFRVTDNVSIIAFNRARDELLFDTAPYKQGVGVSYRVEFDSFGQLIGRYWQALTNRRDEEGQEAGSQSR